MTRQISPSRRPVIRRSRLIAAAVAMAWPSVSLAQATYSWVMEAPQSARDWTQGWNIVGEGAPAYPQTPGDIVNFVSATAGTANSSLTLDVPNAVVGTITLGRTLGTGTFLLQSLAPDNTNTLTISNPVNGLGRISTFNNSTGVTNITAPVVLAGNTPTLRISNNAFAGFQLTGPLTASAPGSVLHIAHSNAPNTNGPANFNINQPIGFSQIHIAPIVTWASIGTLAVNSPLTLQNANVSSAVNSNLRGTFIRTDFTGSSALTVNNVGPTAQVHVTGSGSYTGQLTVNSGSFVLNHNSVNVSGNNASKLGTGATVQLNGATLGLVGSTSAASSVAIVAVTANSGQNTLSVNRNGTQNASLTLNVLNRGNGATLYVTRNAAVATLSTGAFGTGITPVNGLLGGWAIASNTAVNSGQWDFIANSTTFDPATYVAFPAGAGTGTENVSISSNVTTTGASINALRVTGNTTLTLNGNLSLTSGGLLIAAGNFGSANLTIAGTGTLSSASDALYIHQPPNPNGTPHSVTVNAPIAIGSGSLVKTGGGLLTVSSLDASEGSHLRIQGGTYRGPLPAQTAITLSNGGAIDTNGAGTLSFQLGAGPGQLQFAAGGGGFSASGAPAGVSLNNGALLTAAELNRHLVLQSNSATHPLIFSNPLDVTGDLSITVGSDGGNAAFGRAYARIVSGIVGDGSIAISGSPNGMLILETPNNFSGGVLLSGGQIWAESGIGIKDSTPVQIGYGGIWATRGLMDRRLGTDLGGADGGIRWLGEGTISGDANNFGWGGFAAVGGPLTVALKNRDGGLATLAPIAGGLSSGSPASLHLGSPYSNAGVTVLNNFSSASGTVDIRSFGPAVNVIAGNISGTGTVQIAGGNGGTLLLTGDNSGHTGNLAFVNAAGVLLKFASAASAIGQTGPATSYTINNNTTFDPNGVSLTSATPGVFRNLSFSNGSGVAGLGNLINSGLTTVNINDVSLANAPNSLVFGGPGNIRINGILSGANVLVKRGYGNLTIAGASTQTTGMLLSGGSVNFDYTVNAAPKFNGPTPANANNSGGNLQLVAVDLNLVGGAGSVTQPIGGLQLGQSSGNSLAQSAPVTLNILAADGNINVPIGRLVRADNQGSIDFTLASNGAGTPTVTIGAIPNNGVVSTLTLTNGGSGYTTAPTVSFGSLDAGTVAPQATAVIDENGVVTQLILTKQGTALDPATPITVTFSGGGGSGASATATVSALPTIGNFATLNKRHFAALSNGVNGNLVAPTYVSPAAGVGSALANLDVPAGTTDLTLPDVGSIANSLRFADGSADTHFNLTGGYLRLNPHAGGILVTPDVGNRNVTISGQLRWNVNRDLFIYNYAQGTLTLSGTINDIDAGSGLTKVGVGDVVLEGTANIANLRVAGGRLIVRSHATLPTTSIVLGGGTPELSGVDSNGRPIAPTLRYEGAGGNFGGAISLIGPATLDLSGTDELVLTTTGTNISTVNDAPWDLTIIGSSNLRLNGPVRMGSATNVLPGYGVFTHASSGTTTLAGITSRALGGWVVSDGNLVLAHPSDTIQDDNPITVSGGTLTLAGNADKFGSLTLLNGTVTGIGTYEAGYYDLRSGNVNANLGGLLSDLDKSSPGTVTLAGQNTYQGHTTITEGTLVVPGSISNFSPMSVSGSSSLQIPVSGNVAVRSYRQTGAELILGGSLAAAQNVTFTGGGSLTLEIFSDVVFGSITAGGDVLIDNFSLSFTGLGDLSGDAPITLISAASITGEFTLAEPLPQGFTLAYTATTLTLQSPGAPQPASWILDGDGDYDTGSNWSTGTAPNGVSATANFDLAPSGGAAVVTLNSPVTLGVLNFSVPSSYTIEGNGNPLTLQAFSGSALIGVSDGYHSVNTPIVLGSAADISVLPGASLFLTGGLSGSGNLAIGGGGFLVVSGDVTHTGSTALNAGMTIFEGAVLTPNHAVNIAPGTSVEFAATPNLAGEDPRIALHTSALAVGGTAELPAAVFVFAYGAEDNRSAVVQNVVVTGGLSIAHDGGSLGNRTYYGYLNLGNNDMIVRSTSVNHANTLASIRDMVRYWLTANDGLPGFAGLGSSTAFYGSNGFTTLAVFNNNPDDTGIPALATFDGIEVSAYDVLVKYTYIGDTNLDGIVDAADLSRALQGLNGGGTGWNFGDVNYDGVINFTDLGRILAALRGQGGSLGDSTLPPIGSSSIPEPAALSLLALTVPLLSRRRRE